MVEPQLPKLIVWVRFPSLAPRNPLLSTKAREDFIFYNFGDQNGRRDRDFYFVEKFIVLWYN